MYVFGKLYNYDQWLESRHRFNATIRRQGDIQHGLIVPFTFSKTYAKIKLARARLCNLRRRDIRHQRKVDTGRKFINLSVRIKTQRATQGKIASHFTHPDDRVHSKVKWAVTRVKYKRRLKVDVSYGRRVDLILRPRRARYARLGSPKFWEMNV